MKLNPHPGDGPQGDGTKNHRLLLLFKGMGGDCHSSLGNLHDGDRAWVERNFQPKRNAAIARKKIVYLMNNSGVVNREYIPVNL